MSFAHVDKEFVVAEKAFAAEFTQGVDPAFNGVLGRLFGRSMGYRGEMQWEDVGRVKCVFVCKHLFRSDAQVTLSPRGSTYD